MNETPTSKSVISEEDILYIGIPGVKNNLTLNLEWPVEPGTVLPGEGLERAPRVEPAQELTEYKIIIVDPDDLGAIHNPSHAFKVRRSQLRTFLERGGLLVCILRKANWVRCFRSQEQVMNYDFIVQGWHNFTEPRGAIIKKPNVMHEGRISSFSEILKAMKEVTVYLDEMLVLWGQHGTPDPLKVKITPLVVSTNDKIVAFGAKPISVKIEKPSYRYRNRMFVSQGKPLPGKMVFLPDYVLNDIDLLVECAKKEWRRLGKEDFVPEWMEEYKYPGSDIINLDIKSLESKIEKIREEIKDKNAEIEELKQIRNILLYADGKLLERKVKQVFNEIGIEFEVGPKGSKGEERDDLILKDSEGHTVLVCEIRGKGKKSAAEGDAQDLEKWRDRVRNEENGDSQGLLIVNAWREKDPRDDDRLKRSFSDQMMNYCKIKGHCLMTTFQLYNIWCEFKEGRLKEDILKKIMDTNGKQLEGYDDPNANRIA